MHGANEEENRRYMRIYMRQWRKRKRAKGELPPVKSQSRSKSLMGRTRAWLNADGQDFRSGATFDPMRDGPLSWSDPTAQLLGDPPLGRRAIDRR